MRTVNAFVLAAALLAGSGSFLDDLSSLFSSLWASSSSTDSPAPTQDGGCELDPNGKPVCSPAGS
jgi:hypothetical protein